MANRIPPNKSASSSNPTGPARFNFDFIGKRNVAFTLSIASVVICWGWVFARGGLSYGIDFTGGIQHIFKFNRTANPELLAQVREGALAADPSAQVQNIGKPDEGEVMIQVKGFELVERAGRKVTASPLKDLDDLRSRLAEFDVFDTAFYEQVQSETDFLHPERVKKNIAGYVSEATAARLREQLSRRFGKPEGQFDLNAIPTPEKLFTLLRAGAVSRLAGELLEKMNTAKSIDDLTPILKAAGLDPQPFLGKFLLRAPTLEEIRVDLHEYAGQTDRLAAELLRMYPDIYREAFLPSATKIISAKETRSLYPSVDEAGRLIEGPQSGLLKDLLAGSFYTSPFVLMKTDQVSSRIGAELRQKALFVIALSLLVMLVYIWIRFELRFGVGALVTLLHDALTIIPLMAVLGYEYDINMIAAILTLIGYSLNDTIVVYDRIRENMESMRGASLTSVINTSITQTLSRTVVTGVTTLLAVLTLYFYGGPVLEGFSLALFLGILIGTYSSIFVSAPVVYLWPEKK